MSNFKLTTNYKLGGKVGYKMSILRDIVTLAVAEVEGTIFDHPERKNDILFNVDRDAVYVDVSVVIKAGYTVPDIAYRIQQSVKQSVENMTHFRVAKVDVHIMDVVFCSACPEKETVLQEKTEERN